MLLDSLVALGLTVALVPLALVGLRRLHVIDKPSERSSHDRPTARGGGVAPAVGMLVVLGAGSAVTGPYRAALVVGCTGFGLIGLAEDIWGIPALRRLSLHAVVAAITVPWLLQGLHEPPGLQVTATLLTLVWLVAYVNAFNFMDGINGIACAQAIVAGTSWYVIGRAEHVPAFVGGSALLAAATLGFLPYNFPAARVFLGDVGSYFLGAWLAILVVVGLRGRIAPEAVLAPVSLYLVDTAFTLARRVARRERWYAPHRDHAYQRLVRAGWSHTRATALVTTVVVLCSGLGAISVTGAPIAARVAADVAIVCILGAYLVGAEWITIGAKRPVRRPLGPA
ncbi:MAG TPA: glycosyltransferase family 4 protein [Acidimicrobiales bacterium]|nr:glycosyltransferase family 4 protein [Acidimicrobiales bacterium]